MRIPSFRSRWLATLALALCLCVPGQAPRAAAADDVQPAVATSAPAAVPATPQAGVPADAAPAAAAQSADVAAPGSAPAADAQSPADAAPADAAAADAAAATDEGTRGLDEQIQDLKKQVVDLNKDLFVLEEELLFPANTQVAVFVSMDVGDFFGLDSVTLKIDDKDVSNYLYTPRETAALLKGGVQRLYVGNLKAGEHELVAFFSGKGPNERDYRRGASIHFEKGIGAKYLELKITDKVRRQQPEFEIRDWE